MSSETMRAFQFNGKGNVAINSIAVPMLKDENSILIKNDAAIICNMTDTHIYEGAHEPNGPHGWNMPLPCTLGHESTGIVVDKGKAVNDVDIGDRVALCGWFESGSFADYTVAAKGYVKVSPDMTKEQAALVEMLSCTFQIVEQVFRIGDTVLISGCGAAGSLGLKLVAAGGATRIIVSEPHPEKRAYALANGAHFAIDPTTENVVERVKTLNGGQGVDVMLEFSGAAEALKIMTNCVRRQGAIGLFGVCPDPVPISMYDLHMNWAKIVTAGYGRGYTEYSQHKAVALLESGVVNLDDMITHRIRLEDIESAFHMIQKGQENVRKVLIEFD